VARRERDERGVRRDSNQIERERTCVGERWEGLWVGGVGNELQFVSVLQTCSAT
jgi:hypothetical protein